MKESGKPSSSTLRSDDTHPNLEDSKPRRNSLKLNNSLNSNGERINSRRNSLNSIKETAETDTSMDSHEMGSKDHKIHSSIEDNNEMKLKFESITIHDDDRDGADD
jgi:hypothetical protein